MKHKTPEQAEFLRTIIPSHTYKETAKLYYLRFGERLSIPHLYEWAHRHGIKRDINHISWTQDKLDYMAEIIPGHTESEIRELFAQRYGVTLTEGQLGGVKRKLGVKSGTVGGRFEEGQASYNKGKTWDDFIPPESQERCRATQFQKGHLPGNVRAVGDERVSKDGYIEVHVSQHRKSRANDQWRPKHHLVWEQANGHPVPPHTMIVFADRDKRNFDPDNLVAVPRELWSIISQMRIAYHDHESLVVAMDIAKLKRGIQAKRLLPRPCRQCGQQFSPRYAHQRTCDACLAMRSGNGTKTPAL